MPTGSGIDTPRSRPHGMISPLKGGKIHSKKKNTFLGNQKKHRQVTVNDSSYNLKSKKKKLKQSGPTVFLKFHMPQIPVGAANQPVPVRLQVFKCVSNGSSTQRGATRQARPLQLRGNAWPKRSEQSHASHLPSCWAWDQFCCELMIPRYCSNKKCSILMFIL